ncbi:sigma-70 family RNA polymerase sigma factor [Nocardia cyriacigeorgica]|uniref:Sigma-70 family RNA polymerase sigma factor n=2 Tax=Nocardia cyriacigeorgica TaxID=135487 RepID=A0A6P1D6B0_9NOCA|nr:sigma-70 family RNA polymerase sigma factor [Nocardia cyriacigeorgica]NEW39451.1 sigma-70 family RNA polymerase sigma factor [Nocardia cyriacigeorgica]NEW43742.1 sigma-70 family RNA polymerase sigma factor [Nocardia cyriacigeorgica]NEW49971.1 sigma-70 family RNA polymerase sigma factor [Nocardia cyriacigeorgica]NEW54693.1 sigma-70 family RNA polymerase sigma factor [Nocardia cyriacigeorgica]
MATQRTTATTRTGRRQDNPALSESRRVSAELNTLIGPAASGDGRAVTDILRLIHPLVHRYCRSRLGNTAHLQVTADDVVQEILLATVHAIPRYRDQGKSFLAFVYGIAANKVADAFRRSQTHPAYPTDEVPETASQAAGPEEWALASERQRETRQLMEVLAPVHREVLVMRIILGWTAAETADAIGTSPGVVRVMQHRALNKLRAELKVPA